MSTRTLKSGLPTEDAEQISLVDWIRTWESTIPELENFAAIPNGGKRAAKTDKAGKRFSIEAARMKRMGVSAGYPDALLDVPVAPFHGLRIEMKSTDPKAKTSDEQIAWIARLNAVGYLAKRCYGWLAAAREIVEYLRPLYQSRGFNDLPLDPDRWATFARFAASVPRW